MRAILVGRHRAVFARVFLLMTGLWLMTYMAIPSLTVALNLDGRVAPRDVSLTFTIATVVSAAAMILAGHLSTRLGRRRFLIAFGLQAVVLAPILLLIVFAIVPTGMIVIAVAALQVVAVSGYGPIGAYLAELFPQEVRSTGYGVAYSFSIVLPALYPYYLPPLEQLWGTPAALAAMLTLGGALIAAGAVLSRDTDRVSALT